MPKSLESKYRSSDAFRTTVVSQPGAVIHVERIEILDRTRRSLTTGVKSIGSPRKPETSGGTSQRSQV